MYLCNGEEREGSKIQPGPWDENFRFNNFIAIGLNLRDGVDGKIWSSDLDLAAFRFTMQGGTCQHNLKLCFL